MKKINLIKHMAYMFILTKRYCARARLDWEEVATVARGML